MCDRHDGKELDHYCLEHEDIVCEQCAVEDHSQTPCQSMLLVLASKHVAAKVEVGMFDLRKMRSASQAILEGTRLEDTMQTVYEAEEMLETFVENARYKLNKAKSLLRPFSELSREELWKLKTVATKKLPSSAQVKSTITDDDEEARDLALRLKEIRKQTQAVKEVLHTLPSYVEVSINPGFVDALSFDGTPVIVTRKGQVADVEDDNSDDEHKAMLHETIKLTEKSHFRLDHCTDIVLLDECMVASVGDSVQKRDRKRMSFRQTLTIPGAGKLCVIGATTEVSVLQKTGLITIFDTCPSLRILYRLLTDIHYHDVCYLESSQGDTGCPTQSPVFVVNYTNKDMFPADCIDLIQARRTKYPGNLPSFHVRYTSVVDSSFGNMKFRITGARCVSTLQGRFIIVGARNGITCINRTGTLIWTVNINSAIQVLVDGSLVFVCMTNERKVMLLGKNGHVMEENVLPAIDMYPQKLSIHGDTMMVKHTDKDEWIVFKKTHENVDN